MPHTTPKKPPNVAESQSGPIPPQMTVLAVAGLLGLPHATVRDVLVRLGRDHKGALDTRESVRLVVGEIRAKADRSRDPEARKRKDEADARLAELELAKREGEVVPADAFEATWKDACTKWRQIISSATYITPNHRARLVNELKRITLDAEE